MSCRSVAGRVQVVAGLVARIAEKVQEFKEVDKQVEENSKGACMNLLERAILTRTVLKWVNIAVNWPLPDWELDWPVESLKKRDVQAERGLIYPSALDKELDSLKRCSCWTYNIISSETNLWITPEGLHGRSNEKENRFPWPCEEDRGQSPRGHTLMPDWWLGIIFN